MSGSNHPPSTPERDVWEEKAAIIRQLYLCERKTLRQVKTILESEHGFPVHTLSTYETNIRNRLRLRKKLKRTDWPVVHHHVRNRAGKDTGIYLNNIRIPWKKAWKEIRRSGDRSIRNGEPDPLPRGVVVRTPSPVMQSISPDLHHDSPPLVSSPQAVVSFTDQDRAVDIGLQSHPHMPHLTMVPTHGGFDELPLVQYTHNGAGGEGGVVMPGTHNFEVSFYRDFLKTTPWNQLKMEILSIVGQNARPAGNPGADVGLFGQDIVTDFPWSMPVSLAYHTIPPGTTYLPDLGSGSRAPTLNFSTYYFVTKFLYLFSNRKIDMSQTNTAAREVSEFFDLIFGRLPIGLLIKLFETALPTMRAAWEVSVLHAGIITHKNAFTILMKAGLKNREWVFPYGHLCLSFAISMGCIDIVQDLLRVGVRADDEFQRDKLPYCVDKPAILQAIMAGAYRFAEKLIQRCDVNRKIWRSSTGNCRSNFDYFISIKLEPLEVSPRLFFDGTRMRWTVAIFDPDDEIYYHFLDLFLNNRANVDHLWKGDGPSIDMRDLYDFHDPPTNQSLSILDECFYQDTELYERLRPYSAKEKIEITRPGICLSAKKGKEYLQSYLDSRPVQHPTDRNRILEFVLAEQFFRDQGRVDLKIIRTLIDFGVDIHLPHLQTEISSSILLRILIGKFRSDGFTGEASALFTLMIDRGATIDSDVIMAAVTETGLGILPEFSRYAADIRAQGGLALGKAARWCNFQAVSWLLDAGVDINADVHRMGWESPHTVITVACVRRCWLKSRASEGVVEDWQFGPTSIEMLGHLISCGAKLRANSQDSGGFHFLKYLLDNVGSSPVLRTVEFCLDFLAVPGDLATAEETLMESCLPFYPQDCREGLAIYELLFRRGCPMLRESGLASYISCGGRHDLIFEILNAGADVNTYSAPHDGWARRDFPLQAAVGRGDLALVAQLVQRGANVNLPAPGGFGWTALQEACHWRTKSEEERMRQIELIKYLIDRGADVNASAAEDSGMTALQIAALHGDVEVALLLLECGASVNAPKAKKAGGNCALDAAAWKGRLDMVKLLLNTGAHSHDRGQSGYKGAIRLAFEEGHFAVGELIREHVRLFGNCIIVDLDDEQLYQN